jgi:hypothetical protein
MEAVMNKSPIFVKKGVIMSTIELKSSLHDLIEDIEDNNILSAVYLLLAKQQNKADEKDFWDELPDYVKVGIEEGLAQSERGEGIPHDEVMKQIKAKYQRI